jgi:hypothetical protein
MEREVHLALRVMSERPIIALLHDLLGLLPGVAQWTGPPGRWVDNPFRPLLPRPEAIAPLAEQIYAGAWEQMPILGEWLQEHGYWSEGEHCLDPSNQHVKGCWVVDWVMGRE